MREIRIIPGEGLAEQTHSRRSEHWVVVQGTAEAAVDGSVSTICRGESIAVPPGAPHRITNIGTDTLIIIETQIGSNEGCLKRQVSSKSKATR
ncbi:hypothetical protein SCG7086_DR_00030 [Chlamydiales bacterium SCGC AG-110-P3]|nr:hypothetical protein SCG7086_DR_00030 [Chlamydiales bacterium SCGC AG-110-P3]